MEGIAAAIILAMEVWLALGPAVALPFLLWGIDRIDPDADGTYVFRPLLLPGLVLLWPPVLRRWRVLATGREDVQARYRPDRSAHRRLAPIFPLALLAIVVVGLSARQHRPGEVAVVRPEAPRATTSG